MSIIQGGATADGRADGVIWIQRAAEQNLAVAQDRLGLMYLYGDGIEQNTSLALMWIRKAAERGAPAAQLQLGKQYSTGKVVPVDNSEAYYWDSIAAKPVASDVYIYNIADIRNIAGKRAQAIALLLTAAQRSDIDQRVATWVPTPSVRYSGVVIIDP